MAISSLNSITCFSYLHPKSDSPLSGSKVSVGLRLQSPNSFGFANPNLNADFHQKVHKNIQSRPSNTPKRGRVVMFYGQVVTVRIKIPGKDQWYSLDVYNALYRQRILILGDYINDDYSNQLLATMLYLDTVEKEDPKDKTDDSNRMYLYIKSGGGDITPSMAVYDTILSLRSPVSTICLGHAYNMAAFILAAGEKGLRAATPLSTIQLASPSGAAYGKADDVKNESAELLIIRDYLYQELAKQSDQPLDKVHMDLRKSRFFTSHEALEYGLIDRVIKPCPKVPAREHDGDDEYEDEDETAIMKG